MSDFAQDLRALYEAAGGGAELGLKHLVSHAKAHGHTVADATLSDWLKGPSVPRQERHVRCLLQCLIPYLEACALRRSPTHQRTSDEAWSARLSSAQASRKSRQGGRGPRIHAGSPGRLHAHVAEIGQSILPREFVGREEELRELSAFATAPAGQGPAHTWWQADAWAGKSALLAWFVLRHLPTGVEAVSYFIAERLGTNHREDFLRAMTEQLAAVAGKKKPAAGRNGPAHLHDLYEAAARAATARRRTLLLVVDGLDEDADAGPGRQSIAALLPKRPPPGMRVLVSGRPNPLLPDDVPADHPLRDPAVVRRLAVSPAARVIRDMAMRDLHALLDDRDVGCHLVGLLAVARGALSGRDMAELAGVRPYDVDRRLRGVTGRAMAPDARDRLSPAPHEEDEDAGRRTYVLAHDELRRAAADALGTAELAAYEARLHAWADGYRDTGWPEATPDYLLTGYTRLTQRTADAGRLAALALDPRRQLRLVERSAVDVALAELGLAVTAADAGDTAPSLAVLAGAAVSREFLLRPSRPLPRAVLRAAARLGDTGRARSWALASARADAKAVALAEVARVLADTGHADAQETARETAREAAAWARAARCQIGLHAGEDAGEDGGAEPAAARAAVALIATRQVEDGLLLLRSTRGPSTSRYEAWADAIRLLGPDRPASASELLDEMDQEAQELADRSHDDLPEALGVAIQIWATLAAAASPEMADRCRDRILDSTRALWAEAPTLENAGLLATAASALAEARPAEAASLAERALGYVEPVLQASGPLRPEDGTPPAPDFPLTLARIVRALTDTGWPTARARQFLEELPEEFHTDDARAATHEPWSTGGSTDSAHREAERLADEAFRLADLGRDHEARRCLGKALALLPGAGRDARRSMSRLLPDLAGAFVRAGLAADVEALAARVDDPGDLAAVRAAASLAYADAGGTADARTQARGAAQTVRAAPGTPDDCMSGGWASAAQALAGVGEGDAALDLIEAAKPTERVARAAWRTSARQARIAVATVMAAHAPSAAGRLIDEEHGRLLAARNRPGGLEGLLAGLAELLPAAAVLEEECRERLHHAVRDGLAYADEPPQTWKAETVLVHALLRIAEGKDATPQLTWLDRDVRAQGPEQSPMGGLAVVHALRGDTDAAWQTADLLPNPEARAAAFAAVAGHLARVPARIPPVRPVGDHGTFTDTIRALALTAAPSTPPDLPAAAGFLRQALEGDGWHHALAVLAHLAPEALAPVRDITFAHLRTGTSPWVPGRG
ncbi:hypothetical protein [Streptomyces sp. NPDC090022]|uniref:hypothetical protein n=1 Tax=Streptomyces sp. NPDC090022 TaxID=3365920 RepID=UPI0038017B45